MTKPDGIIVAVDTVIFSVIRGALHVLLIEIKSGPYDGKWAVPGGIVHSCESLDEAAERVLAEKAGVDGLHVEQLSTFGAIDRDARGRSISVAYFALVASDVFSPKTTDYYADIAWKRTDRLPAMAFDHKAIIAVAKNRLAAKLGYSNIAYALLPKEFTLSEFQCMYEAILGRSLDKRNFRKKIREIGLVAETGAVRRAGATRPAKLYAFSERKPRIVDVL